MPISDEEIVLAGLAAGGHHATYSPAQVQKLFFLIDREIANLVNGPHFQFKPYDYGPFDRAVYDTLDALKQRSLVVTDHNGWYRIYSLTEAGFTSGSEVLGRLSVPAGEYFRAAAAWVRSLGFRDLVAAIYAKYPDMKANSIFKK